MRKFMDIDNGMCKCPLMGASSAVSMIDGAYMLVIGTEECTTYTKATQTLKSGGRIVFQLS